MKRLISGSILSVLLVGLAACRNDPTSSLRNGTDHLTADPGALSLVVGAPLPTSLIVGAVDAQGNATRETFTFTLPGLGVSVTRDTTFATEYNGTDPTPHAPASATRFRYTVDPIGATAGTTSFVVSGGGKNVTIGVVVN
ncbi:MAG: hypothetical protein ACREMO_11520 [Gemmatimonadales bacterium]